MNRSTKKRLERLDTARKITAQLIPLASSYIQQYTIAHGERVLICSRVSTPKQEKNGDLEDQDNGLRRFLERLGATVVGIFHYVGSGGDTSWTKEMAATAIKNKADAVLMESTDRYLRHSEAFKGRQNYGLQPRAEDFDKLLEHTAGIRLTTMLHPDTPLNEILSFQRKRGQASKDRRGGRPSMKARTPGYKKRIREEWLPIAIHMHYERGYTSREIAKYIRQKTGHQINQSTVFLWIKSTPFTAYSSVENRGLCG